MEKERTINVIDGGEQESVTPQEAKILEQIGVIYKCDDCADTYHLREAERADSNWSYFDGAIAALRASPSKRRILIESGGGVIQNISADDPDWVSRNLQVDVIDYDEGDDAACVTFDVTDKI